MVKLCCFLLIFATSIVYISSVPNDANYVWKNKSKYYFSTIEEKMEEILLNNCSQNYQRLKDGVMETPKTSEILHISVIPVASDILDFWKSIPKPTQMRVEPFLCENVYAKKLPIFNNTGCQLPTYMSPSAPRCQTQYLRWICEQSQLDITNTKPNHFVLPEAGHSTTFLPPQPWILMAKDSFVSMCGQISGPCG